MKQSTYKVRNIGGKGVGISRDPRIIVFDNVNKYDYNLSIYEYELTDQDLEKIFRMVSKMVEKRKKALSKVSHL